MAAVEKATVEEAAAARGTKQVSNKAKAVTKAAKKAVVPAAKTGAAKLSATTKLDAAEARAAAAVQRAEAAMAEAAEAHAEAQLLKSPPTDGAHTLDVDVVGDVTGGVVMEALIDAAADLVVVGSTLRLYSVAEKMLLTPREQLRVELADGSEVEVAYGGEGSVWSDGELEMDMGPDVSDDDWQLVSDDAIDMV